MLLVVCHILLILGIMFLGFIIGATTTPVAKNDCHDCDKMHVSVRNSFVAKLPYIENDTINFDGYAMVDIEDLQSLYLEADRYEDAIALQKTIDNYKIDNLV